MSSHLSVSEILTKLEARIASHREKAAFHIQQEAQHREQGIFHTAELEKVTAHYEAFKVTAATAAGLAQEAAPPQAGGEAEEKDLGPRPMASKLIARVVDRLPPGETFGPTRVAAEVNRRYKDRLRKPVEVRTVAVNLRRLSEAGGIRRVSAGTAHHESRFTK
jgi:hypothetical protein